MLVAIAACFAAFVRSWFGASFSFLDLIPVVSAVALVTVFSLARAVKRGRTNAQGLIGTGAATAFSTTSLFVAGAAIVWSIPVYADDSKRLFISPSIIVVYALVILGSIAAASGAVAGFVCYLRTNSDGWTGDSLNSLTGNHGMHTEDSAARLDNGCPSARPR